MRLLFEILFLNSTSHDHNEIGILDTLHPMSLMAV